MTDLLALAARCERADGEDRELDAAIMARLYRREERHIGATHYNTGERVLDWVWVDPVTDRWVSTHPHPYTASLDAALTLVPAGHWWTVGSCRREHHARVCPEGADADTDGIECFGPTAAAALCAASLQARAAMEADDDDQ